MVLRKPVFSNVTQKWPVVVATCAVVIAALGAAVSAGLIGISDEVTSASPQTIYTNLNSSNSATPAVKTCMAKSAKWPVPTTPLPIISASSLSSNFPSGHA